MINKKIKVYCESMKELEKAADKDRRQGKVINNNNNSKS